MYYVLTYSLMNLNDATKYSNPHCNQSINPWFQSIDNPIILDLSWWEPLLVKFIRPFVLVHGELLSGLHGSFASLVHCTMSRRAHLLCLKIGLIRSVVDFDRISNDLSRSISAKLTIKLLLHTIPKNQNSFILLV